MPSRWTNDFIQKIKDQVGQRIEERVKRELTPGINAPAIGTKPPAEQVDPGFLNRIKKTVKEKVTKLTPVQNRLLNPNAPLDEATIKYRIAYCGQNRLLALVKYSGTWRLFEFYSYRISPKDKKLLVFGWCRLHSAIHCLHLHKIEGLQVTNQTYSARYPVEF